MIRFDNWKIVCDGPLLAMQYDNLTRELRVVGNLPEGYDFAALVQVNRYGDIIPLKRTADGAVAALTAEQLSQSGYYTIQLRGAEGEKVRHTNTIRVTVGRSLSGDVMWPEIPSAFTEWEKEVQEKLKSSVEAAENAAEEAQKAVGDAAWISAEVDETGHLILTQTDNFSGTEFAINENGNLEVTYT